MECGCDMYLDQPELYDEQIRRAAKPYLCVECREVIQKGESHLYSSCLFDGLWSHWRTCKACKRIGNDLCGGCWEVGGLWSAIGMSPRFPLDEQSAG